MARRLFFVPEVRRGIAELTGVDAEHLARVLRAEPGEVYEISDNGRAFLARIQTAHKKSVVFEVIEELPARPAQAAVTLFPALFKFDRFEWMLEKATELGVTRIEPFAAVRSERGLDQAAVKRLERWKRIAFEASQQSRRRTMPELALHDDVASALSDDLNCKLLLDESVAAPPLSDLCGTLEKKPADRIGLILGPEGGWTDAERQQILNSGWMGCSLGTSILRAETAAIAGLSAVNVLWRR